MSARHDTTRQFWPDGRVVPTRTWWCRQLSCRLETTLKFPAKTKCVCREHTMVCFLHTHMVFTYYLRYLPDDMSAIKKRQDIRHRKKEPDITWCRRHVGRVGPTCREDTTTCRQNQLRTTSKTATFPAKATEVSLPKDSIPIRRAFDPWMKLHNFSSFCPF